MKISQHQKAENRRNIINALVDMVMEKDLKSATMRGVAKQAGLGEATIYNYFPTKDAMVYAYYGDRLDQAVETLKAIPDFNTYTFQEQLQTFFETMLAVLLPHRAFLDKTFKAAFFTFSQDYARIKPVKEKFIRVVRDIFDAAIEAGEIPDQVFLEISLQVFWEYFIGMIMYWLKDDSDGFSATTVLIDKTLDLAGASIRAGIANKVFDMGMFLFKNHVLSRLDLIRERVDMVHGIKRKFMDGINER